MSDGHNTLIWVRLEAFQIPAAALRSFEDGDHLLICKHVFEDHYRGPLGYHPGGKFNRKDGSSSEAKVTLFCEACKLIHSKDRDCHEWVFRDGKFWVADRLPKLTYTGGSK